VFLESKAILPHYYRYISCIQLYFQTKQKKKQAKANRTLLHLKLYNKQYMLTDSQGDV